MFFDTNSKEREREERKEIWGAIKIEINVLTIMERWSWMEEVTTRKYGEVWGKHV